MNPASGERITFRQTAADTNGELVSIDLALPAGGRVPGGLHIHPLQEERFEVVEGTMHFRLRRERILAGPGDVVIVPPGVPHDFANGGDEDALVRVEVRPALQMEQLFETAVALAEQGRTMRRGIPKPLDLALFTRRFAQEVQAAFPPLWLQRVALAPLAWLAGRRDSGGVLAGNGDHQAQASRMRHMERKTPTAGRRPEPCVPIGLPLGPGVMLWTPLPPKGRAPQGDAYPDARVPVTLTRPARSVGNRAVPPW